MAERKKRAAAKTHTGKGGRARKGSTGSTRGSQSKNGGARASEPSSSNGQGNARGRAFWSGTITFGLVTIPVDLFPARRAKRVSLRTLDDDGTPLARKWCCPKDQQFLDDEQIVRGYEIEPDRFVVVTDEELEALEPRKSRDIDLRRFVPRDAIDPRFFEHGYFLAPATDSTKAYRLLAEVMEGTGRAGIATFVMRDKEYLVAILADNGVLSAETMRFADELREPQAAGLPKTKKAPRARVARIEQAIDALAAKRVDLEELEDEEADRVLALVERKRKRGEDVVEAPELAEEEGEQAEIIDLMEVLKRSLGEKSGSSSRPKARHAHPPKRKLAG